MTYISCIIYFYRGITLNQTTTKDLLHDFYMYVNIGQHFCVSLQVFLFSQETLCSALSALAYLNSCNGFCYVGTC